MKDCALLAIICVIGVLFTILLARVAYTGLERSQASQDTLIMLHKLDYPDYE